MKERPINLKAQEVRAILEGRKTQLRRLVLPHSIEQARCPFGQVGDRMWVREPFDPIYPQDIHYNGGRTIGYDYRATHHHGGRLATLGIKKRWTPSTHMPREASRILLGIAGLRVERLHEISEADAIAEGVQNSINLPGGRFANENFAHLWRGIYGDKSWNSNPWVWVIEFDVLGRAK